jgi:hypothetical protein
MSVSSSYSAFVDAFRASGSFVVRCYWGSRFADYRFDDLCEFDEWLDFSGGDYDCLELVDA